MKVKILLLLLVFLGLLLRFYQLGKVPLSLYWDEASLGYNAYAIAQTGRDEHGEFLPISRFIAFGDYKPPGYIYATAVSVKLFGLSEFSVRLPSAISGILLVLLTYFLAKELFGKKKTALIAAWLMTLSPWAIQFSRAAFEANLATFFGGFGIYCFIRAIRTNNMFTFLVSSAALILSMYTFNTHRVFIPPMILILLFIYYRHSLSGIKRVIIFVSLSILLVIPMLPHLLSAEGKLRFNEVAWINDLTPIELSNRRSEIDGNNLISRILHNRRIIYAQEFLKHYTDHFRPEYLFFSGDPNPKLSVQTVGEFYWWDLPLLISGAFFLFRLKSKSTLVILCWIGVGLMPAALARETPHALRTLNLLPIPQIVAALGAMSLLGIFINKKMKFILLIFSLIYLGSFSFYLHDYYYHYPTKSALEWQYGYKQMVEYISSVQNQYDGVSVTNNYGRPYIYFLFYDKYSPLKYWQSRRANRDSFGLWSVYGFDKYYFDEDFRANGKWLYVRAPNSFPNNSRLIKTIVDPDGIPVFEIYQSI